MALAFFTNTVACFVVERFTCSNPASEVYIGCAIFVLGWIIALCCFYFYFKNCLYPSFGVANSFSISRGWEGLSFARLLTMLDSTWSLTSRDASHFPSTVVYNLNHVQVLVFSRLLIFFVVSHFAVVFVRLILGRFRLSDHLDPLVYAHPISLLILIFFDAGSLFGVIMGRG